MSSGSRVECRQNRRRGKRLSSSGAWPSFNVKQGIQPPASGDPEPDIRLARLPEAMLENDPNIADFLLDSIQPARLTGPVPFLARALRKSRDPVSMPAESARLFAGGGKSLAPELPDGLQRAKPRRSLSPVHDENRLVDQGTDQVDHSSRGQSVVCAHDLQRVEVETVCKHRHSLPQELLVIAEQVIAPLDRSLQRLMALQRRLTTAREQAEAIIESLGYRVDIQNGQADRCQLDGQRVAVKSPAQPRNVGVVVGCDLKPRHHRASPIREQAGSVGGQHGLEACRLVWVGKR